MCAVYGISSGVAIISAISASKIINNIINRKNCSEKGFRVVEFRFIPHSKDEIFSDHFFIVMLRIKGTCNNSIIINMIIDE